MEISCTVFALRTVPRLSGETLSEWRPPGEPPVAAEEETVPTESTTASPLNPQAHKRLRTPDSPGKSPFRSVMTQSFHPPKSFS